MKKIPKTIQVDAYMDEDGKPVCGYCVFVPTTCDKNRWHKEQYSIPAWKPGPDCPVWRKQGNTGAEDDQP